MQATVDFVLVRFSKIGLKPGKKKKKKVYKLKDNLMGIDWLTDTWDRLYIWLEHENKVSDDLIEPSWPRTESQHLQRKMFNRIDSM